MEQPEGGGAVPHRIGDVPGTRRWRPAGERVRYVLAPATACLLLAGGLAVAACGEPAAERARETIPPHEFVEVVVALRQAERELADDSAGVRYLERRDEILEAHGVTASDLGRFLQVHRSDIELLSEVWDTVNERLKYVPEAAGDEVPEDVRALDPTDLPARRPPAAMPGLGDPR